MYGIMTGEKAGAGEMQGGRTSNVHTLVGEARRERGKEKYKKERAGRAAMVMPPKW